MPENFDINVFLSDPEKRDLLTRYFLSENREQFSRLTDEQKEKLAANLLGSDKIKLIELGTSLDNTLFNYGRIFELCQIIGAASIYDIGCAGINQSFLLINYSALAYTGISPDGFILETNLISDSHTFWKADEVPAFCDGRIRFVRGYYPDALTEISPNSIAVACYSMTMLRTEEQIQAMASSLTKDFDRILFNIPSSDPIRTAAWKKADWTGFEIYPIGPEGFLFATKHREDITRMKNTYPFVDGHFETGIDDFMRFQLMTNELPEGVWPYIKW